MMDKKDDCGRIEKLNMRQSDEITSYFRNKCWEGYTYQYEVIKSSIIKVVIQMIEGKR